MTRKSLKFYSRGQMLKIVSKTAQSFMEEIEDVDWGDPRQQPPAPAPQAPEESLVDDIMEEEDLGGIEPFRDDPAAVDFMDEIPLISPDKKTFYGIPPEAPEVPYAGIDEAVADAFANAELIAFEYTTRHGTYAGVRIVEPHFTRMAQTTGNEILMTYDRTAGENGDIRSFIIGNIHPNVVRYEGVQFMPKSEIMKGA